MAASPEIPQSKEELEQAEAVYADLVALYPDNEAYLQYYAEILLASNKITTATEALRQLHDLIAARAPDKAAALARKYPQIGRVDHSNDEQEAMELGEALRKEFGIIWIRLHQQQLVEGQPLYQQDDFGDTLYLILKGEVAVTRRLKDGQQAVIDIVKSIDVVGEGAFLTPGPRLTDIVANSKTTYVELPRKRLLSFLLDNPYIERLLEQKTSFRQMLRLISSTPLLQAAPMEMRKYMAEQSKLIRYPAGTLIHQAGEELAYVDMLVHGEARLAVRPQPDKMRFVTLENLTAGELIGDASAVRKASCPADILATSDVLMAHIPLSAFTNVIAAHPPLREKLMLHAEEWRKRIMRQIITLGKGQPST